MLYNQPYGISDPNAAYINGNPATGTAGSIPPAASIEYPQREIVNLIAGTGITPANGDLNQLAKAIQSGQLFYGLDTGSSNHLVTNLTPTPNSIVRGMYAIIHAAATNTGATDLTTNGLSAAVTRTDGSVLVSGDIKANAMVMLIFDGVHWQLPFSGGATTVKILGQNLDLYVNGPIGNDANDGSANDAAHAFRTIQHGVDVAQSYQPSQYGVNIHIADATYNESVLTSPITTPAINIIGNVATPGNVIIGLSGACTFPKLCGLGVQGPNTMNVQGVTARSGTFATDNPGGFIAVAGAVMNVSNTASLFAQGGVFEAFGGSTINFNGNHSFGANSSPSTGSLFLGYQAGNIYVTGQIPITFTVAAVVSVAEIAGAIDNGVVLFQLHHAIWAGSTPTGTRYSAVMGGIIDTQGGGANYFPGTIAGTLASGGQYQ
jgi:hypothetical protein